jgi:trehalose monomycolate/heme transporter
VFTRIGHFAFRHRKPILIFYALLIVPLVYAASTVFGVFRGGGFEVQGSESQEAFMTIEREIKVGGADVLALWTTDSGTVDDIENYTAAIEALTRVEQDPEVLSVASWYTTQAPQLISKDRTRTFMLIAMMGDDHQRRATMERILPLLEAKPMTLQVGGVIAVNSAVQRIIAEDLTRAESFAFPITALLLLWIFGSVMSASLPLVLTAMTVLVALAGLRTIAFFGSVSIFSVNIVLLLGGGLAIDYSLFLVNRFREELKRYNDVEKAVVRTVETTGRAVAFSGVTVAASLIGLYLFPQMFLNSMASGGIMVVLGTVTLSLTMLPAMMAVVGFRIDAWRLPYASRVEEDETKSIFYHIAHFVMKRPILTTVAVLVPLIAVGLPFLRFNPSFPDYRILPTNEPAYIASEILDREFDGDQLTPIDVLVQVEGSAFTRENLLKLAAVSDALEALKDKPGLSPPKMVSGLFTLIPGIPREKIIQKLSTPFDVLEKEDATVLMGIKAFARGSYMRFAVLLDNQYNAPESLAVIEAIKAMEMPGVTILVGGPGSYLLDMKASLRDHSPWMVLIVMIVMFIVLFFVFGSVTLPIKAMFMNALSISASFGAIVWIFQDGKFSELLHYIPLGISDTTAPILMFAIVFGLSMDYEVLILSRIQEEYLKSGDNDEAVAKGLARTGRLITSAALLLVVVIGAFGTSDIIFMKSLGIGMALAILLDATIIRALLVPAAMKLMGKWNWWAPAPLTRLWKRFGLFEPGDH